MGKVVASRMAFTAEWAVNYSLEVEKQSRGFMARLMQCRSIRRHLIFGAMAKEIAPKVIPDYLDINPRHIAERVFGSMPIGFLGALRRLQNEPLLPHQYDFIHKTLDNENNPKRQIILQTGGMLNSTQLEALIEVNDRLVHPAMMNIRNPDEARLLSLLYEKLMEVCPTASPDAVRDSLMTSYDVSKAVSNILGKHLETKPIEVPVGFIHLRDGITLVSKSLEYRNCMRSRLLSVSTGMSAYIEFENRIIVELIPTANGGWIMFSAWKHRNALPSREEYSEIAALLREVGIESLALLETDARRVHKKYRESPFEQGLPELMED